MQSKTYDSVTEKYLDFSFEKTNSAYMLFYEWRSGKGGNEQRNQSESPTTISPGSSVSQLQDTGKSDEAQASTSDQVMVDDADKVETGDATPDCDIENRASTSYHSIRKFNEDYMPRGSSSSKTKRKSLLNKDLEEWIWQDNRHYLEDRNIFEHTYFK